MEDGRRKRETGKGIRDKGQGTRETGKGRRGKGDRKGKRDQGDGRREERWNISVKIYPKSINMNRCRPTTRCYWPARNMTCSTMQCWLLQVSLLNYTEGFDETRILKVIFRGRTIPFLPTYKPSLLLTNVIKEKVEPKNEEVEIKHLNVSYP